MKNMRLLNDVLNSYQNFNLWENSILLCYRGSVAHGTHIPNNNPNSIDDQDVIGVLIPPDDYILGMKTFEQFETIKDPWDILIYDFRKFIRLLSNANPNVLSVLWTKKEHRLKETWQSDKLVENRHLFASKKIYKSFCGYSLSQLHKMENMAYNGYMGKKRKELVDKFGFDCKSSAHLIRLLKQGIEFLNTGELNVDRTNIDKNELIQIKTGQWSLQKVKDTANFLFKQIEEAKDNSKLPDDVDKEKINDLVFDIMNETYINRWHYIRGL